MAGTLFHSFRGSLLLSSDSLERSSDVLALSRKAPKNLLLPRFSSESLIFTEISIGAPSKEDKFSVFKHRDFVGLLPLFRRQFSHFPLTSSIFFAPAAFANKRSPGLSLLKQPTGMQCASELICLQAKEILLGFNAFLNRSKISSCEGDPIWIASVGQAFSQAPAARTSRRLKNRLIIQDG